MSPLAFNDFETAGRAVLAFLHRQFGFGLWMITRTEGNDWIVLQTEDHGYGVKPGTVFNWADSFCSEMVQGNGPRIAPDSSQIPAYAAAPIGRQVPIGAYIGVPLQRDDGSLFGTLCAIDPTAQPEAIAHAQELLELLAGLLGSLLNAELRANETLRKNEQLELDAQTDALTGLGNRRAWDETLAHEEERCRRYGHRAAVFVLDLDELKRINDSQGHAAGDALLVEAAKALREAARHADVVARLGGDEFGILAVECDQRGADALLERMAQSLDAHGVCASTGMAVRDPGQGLARAWELADQRMYEVKKSRSKNGSPATAGKA